MSKVKVNGLKAYESMKKKYLQAAKNILSIESNAIRDQIKHLDNDFWKACELIHACTGRVVVMGIGKSGLIGRKFSATLSSTGTPSFFLHPVESLHGDIGMITGNDIVLALSYSGETAELNNVFPLLKSLKVTLIVFTARPQSKLGKAGDVVVRCAIRKEACPYNIVPTSSTIAMMAIGDTLALTVMGMRGFRRDDFARLHPGGTLGKKLLLTVNDLMHQGTMNPKVPPNKKVREVIFTMTRYRLGATNIVDASGNLVGFFTDGDLRRHLQKDPLLLEKPVGEVMTKKPLTVRPGMLAIEAARILKTHKFDNLPVTDKKGRSLGILDERDLMAEGIA